MTTALLLAAVVLAGAPAPLPAAPAERIDA